jgi:bacterioferritin-associated ferredoxin
MGVDRCICHNITFSRLKEEAARVGGSFDALSEMTGCSTNCGMCKPYVISMLLTGRTVFPVLSEPAAARIVAEWEAIQAKRVAGLGADEEVA